MKNQTISILATHPVMLNILEAGYSFETDWPEGVAEMRKILDTHDGPLFIVDDVRAMKLSINDLIVASSLVGRGEAPLYRHPNALGICFISDSRAVEMAAEGMHSSVFDNMTVKVFHTLEDALADIEQVMAH